MTHSVPCAFPGKSCLILECFALNHNMRIRSTRKDIVEQNVQNKTSDIYVGYTHAIGKCILSGSKVT